MAKKTDAELVSNRKAHHNYEILETFEAGIALKGTEVKSLRDHGGSLQEAYIKVMENELWLIGCSIAPWRYGNIHNHEERRERKLLMHKKEIAKLKVSVQEKGFTIIPLAMYLKSGRVKIKIATARGKSTIDKRQSIKDKDEKRHIDKMLKNYS
jgi:SsrA-binding protein